MRYDACTATEADKETIQLINNRCYREVVETQFGAWDSDLQRGFFKKKWDSSHYQKIVVDSEIAGVLTLVRNADHYFISEILIDPAFQGKGLGTAVVSEIIQDASDYGVPVGLQVLRKNRAKALYDRLGFGINGETDTHFLMERTVQCVSKVE